MTQHRALLAIRLSVRTDETTSPQRQEDATRAAATHYGLAVAGIASDIDVSATKTTPWERPQLGDWLAHRSHDFDALVFWRLDRAVRSMVDMSALVGWARTHRKRLIFAEGPGGGSLELDLSGRSPVAELLTQVFAFAAQMEALSISERITGARAAIRTMPHRFAGGPPSYGYMTAPNPYGPGKTLVRNPAEVRVLSEIIRRILDSESLNKVCSDLNARGVLPRQGARRGKTTYWHSGALLVKLRSPALMGHKTNGHHYASTVRKADGSPVLSTDDPLLTEDEFNELQRELDSRKKAPVDRSDTKALLLGVAHCANCGKRMYLNRAKPPRSTIYACARLNSGIKCEHGGSVVDHRAERFAEENFLRAVGSLEYTEAVHHGGEDPGPEIDRCARELDLMADQLANAGSDAARKVWQTRVDALSARLTELEARPVVEPWIEHRPTGKRVADVWEDGDAAVRRNLMTQAGARVWVYHGDLRRKDRLVFDIIDPDWAEAADTLAAVADEESA
ncbi:recombinase family protein [Nocardiopsis nanhaiensis]